jgi:vacuolar-type H+-ATPase subunit I/STV1
MFQFMHSLYLVDEVEKDPITREQLVKVEKAFDKAEGERLKAVAALGKVREEKGVLQTKLKEGEARAVVLKEEIERLSSEVERLRLKEQRAEELQLKVDEIPGIIQEAAREAAERAVEEFKKSPEMAQLLREQHRKSVAENTSLYKTRGWLNVEKLLADRKADREKRAEEEKAAAEMSGQGEGVPAETEAEADRAKL